MINLKETLMDFGVTAFSFDGSIKAFRVDYFENLEAWINISSDTVRSLETFDFLKNEITEE